MLICERIVIGIAVQTVKAVVCGGCRVDADADDAVTLLRLSDSGVYLAEISSAKKLFQLRA